MKNPDFEITYEFLEWCCKYSNMFEIQKAEKDDPFVAYWLVVNYISSASDSTYTHNLLLLLLYRTVEGVNKEFNKNYFEIIIDREFVEVFYHERIEGFKYYYKDYNEHGSYFTQKELAILDCLLNLFYKSLK